MHYQKPVLAGFLFLIAGLFACNSNEIGASKDVNQDKIYMDYQVSYTEGEEEVDLNFQYRFAGPAGTTLVLDSPSVVKLDNEMLIADSSKYGGAFYTVNKKYSGFAGNHTIGFTDINGKQFDNVFEFSPFTLVNLPATADRNKDLVISYNINGLSKEDNIELSSYDTDSTFHVQQYGPANTITIPAADLKRQKKDEVSFDAVIYRKLPLARTTSEGGALMLTYRLKPVKIKLQP